MNNVITAMDEDEGEREALGFFEREIGATNILTKRTLFGNQLFLKFIVGKEAPYYDHALRATQKALSPNNPFLGKLDLEIEKIDKFPASLEAAALLTLLARSTRAVVQESLRHEFSVPYVPFQNREDHLLSQPATHLVVGRRGVGKSTLIRRAVEILKGAQSPIVAVIDFQTYGSLTGEALAREVLHDVGEAIVEDSLRLLKEVSTVDPTVNLRKLIRRIVDAEIAPGESVPSFKRAIAELSKAAGSSVFVFLDDFHLVNRDEQPHILHLLHGALKGANGWLKVAGLRSLLNAYSPKTLEGLQVPGDAQRISLDLTLENPAAAEMHLKAILASFLKAVGYSVTNNVLPDAAFHRLVWANAGVPRDFLQMFGRAIDHARRNKHAAVTVSDVNVAIGEFGQGKMDELVQDARNSEGDLRKMLAALENFCLDEHKTNGFLVRSEDTIERELILTLSDLRLVHLISQSTTPDKAGERYQAFILDYSLFTGFRRRPNIKEMTPQQEQFLASELRKLPKVPPNFLAEYIKNAVGG